ncbi:RNA polymerase sigma factor [Saccharicrinis sp. FJH62]|uniref:RNA polymerase sigma factor n=1 Tax=Saccharicrinis sp. FJH62 TaxID=3344657 RepID=UPI0035D520F8
MGKPKINIVKKEDTFNRLVSENSERIRRICCYYNSNPDDQKDMYQEVLVNVWKSLDNFRGDANINTWIYRIAVNTSLTFTGKAFKEMKLLVRQDAENLSSILDDEDLAAKKVQETQLENLQLELNQLSVIDKALISLVLEGLSMKDIADIIGISEANVKVKIHRIKQQLKENLKAFTHEK